MNRRGTPKNLVPAHRGNVNAVRFGVHSPRLIEARAREIEAELFGSVDCSPTLRLPLHELTRLLAIRELIDHDLEARGLEDKDGQPRYLIDKRIRVSRQIERWWVRVVSELERQTEAAREPVPASREECVRELERIAFRDSSATARDRLNAIKERLEWRGIPYRGDPEDPFPDPIKRLASAEETNTD